ncbi:MAG: HPF/RaiA family ribosome-associated protein [Bacteroidales bacterium]|jgi:putative sigma-54 modulation protein|nr:HPF/RaiA family ribosome-associated protein [Bacteroidales bacterium]
MEIKVQSIKFDADQKLLEFIDKKLGKLDKFYEDVIRCEVTLSLLAEYNNKNALVRVLIPGSEVVVERNADSFEDAIVDCASILKDKLVSVKEKRFK